MNKKEFKESWRLGLTVEEMANGMYRFFEIIKKGTRSISELPIMKAMKKKDKA